uniref:SSD domain-containing protein n=1 Tax=Ascaris lumbricoides TaxID=6252 RepID=A0A9J2P7S9_ASCLU
MACCCGSSRKNGVCRWAPLEQPWASMLGRYCRFVARHPWPFIVIPTAMTCFLSSGIFFNFKIVRSVHYLYAPVSAKWKFEEEVFHQNWAATDEQFYPGKDILRRKGLYLILEANDYGDVLRRPYANEFIDFLDWLETEKFSIIDGLEYSYRNICLRFQNDCFTNAHARFLADVYSRGDQMKLNVTYPKFYSQYSTEPIDLSKTLGGVKVDSHQRLLSATTWMILYQLKQHSDLMLKLSSNFETAVSERIKSKRIPSTLFNVYYFHSDTFEQELAENNRRVAPSFALTFAILSIFSVLCTFNFEWISTADGMTPVVDWVVSKPLMGIVGVAATVMAIASAAGLLLLLDVTFVDMATVMPFLSLTVGIDDTFLMLAAWHETSRTMSVEDRIEISMRRAAVSISITSLTDALAFLIGAIAPLPAVMYFCYYSSAAICFIFAYSLTIFVACLSIQGRWEEANRNCIAYTPTIPIEQIENSTFMQRCLNMGSRSDCGLRKKKARSSSPPEEITFDDRLWYQRFFEDLYAPFITSPTVQIAALISFICYAAIAYAGACNVKVGFELINVIQKDSPSRRFLEIKNTRFPNDVSKLDVAVMRPPNMGNATQRRLFLEALSDLERTLCSVGRNTTDFWYFAYQRFVDRLGFGDSWAALNEDETVFNMNLRPFLMANERYDHDILYYPNKSMSAFRLTMQLVSCPSDERIMRSTADKYRDEFNITTYTPLWALADQLEIIWPQTMQDLYISIAVMVQVSLFFIPQPLCALIIVLNIASVALGVIGFMTLWDVNLDATSMITIAMSVGFSVDFAAHITYGYMTECKAKYEKINAPYARLVGVLGAVGWPVSQASISVVLGIMTLSTLDSYMVQTCFKTVLLVIIIGTFHALLYLPLILMHSHSLFLKINSTIKAHTAVLNARVQKQ